MNDSPNLDKVVEALPADHPARQEYLRLVSDQFTLKNERLFRSQAQRDFRHLCALLRGEQVKDASPQAREACAEIRDRLRPA